MKSPMRFNWTSYSKDEMPEVVAHRILAEHTIRQVKGDVRCWRAMPIRAWDERQAVHLCHSTEGFAYVCWTGPGFDEKQVVRLEGGLEACKRLVDSGKVSNGPEMRSGWRLPTTCKRPAKKEAIGTAKVTDRMVAHARPSQPLALPAPTKQSKKRSRAVHKAAASPR